MKKTNFHGPHSQRRTINDFTRLHDDFAPHLMGTISLSRSGVGFFTPEEGSSVSLEQDLLIPERELNMALPGDSVEVELLPPDRKGGRPLGRVVRILERAQRDIVCTLHREGRYHTAIPMLACGNHTFNIKEPGTAKDGDRVIVRFSSWKNPTLNPDAEIVSVIGKADNPSLDTKAIEAAYDLPQCFPDEVLEEAQQVSTLLKQPGEREDLRELTIITIDPDAARDYDDALSYQVDAEGRRILGVHIADVSHFVRVGSALDKEARKRGTSVYLVDHVLPMLPEQLSNGVCSLVQGEDRLAFSVFLTFSEQGRVIERRFAHSVIRSARRMTYGEAMKVIECDGAGPEEFSEAVRQTVMNCHALSQQLRKNRLARFSLDLSSQELELKTDENGRVISVERAEHNVAHELVEEAMIIANEAVASELAAKKIPHLSRFHDAPEIEKLEELEKILAAIGIKTGSLQTPGALVRLLNAVRNTGLEYYVSMQILRSMKRAEYNADQEGHYGLAKRFYSHFTSPIRRYPDLVAHRQMTALLAGDRSAQPSLKELREIASSSTKTEFNAAQAERDLTELKKYRFLEEQLAAHKLVEFKAVVVSVQEYGVFAEIPDLQVSGMAHVSAISNQYLRYDSRRGVLTGSGGVTIAAGSHVRVMVTSVSYESRHIDFQITEVEKNSPSKMPKVESSKDLRHEERRVRRASKKVPDFAKNVNKKHSKKAKARFPIAGR